MTTQQLQASIDAACAKLEQTAALMGLNLTYELSAVRTLEEIAQALKKMAKGDLSTSSGGSFLIGAFLGEVIRRELGGEWRGASESEALAVALDEFTCYPIARVRKYMAEATGNSLVFFAQASAASRAA